METLVVQFVDTAPGENNNINADQVMLLLSKCFPDDALNAVPLHRQTHIALGDDQPQTGMRQRVMSG